MSTVQPFDNPSQASSDDVFCPPLGGLIVYRKSAQDDSCTAPNRPLLKAVNSTTLQAVFFRPRCNTWSCPACAKRNAKKAVFRAVYGAEVLIGMGAELDFLTVTSHEKLDAAASLAVLPKAWHKLHRRFNREVNLAEYFAVPEQHKDGRWHMHAIVSFRLPKKWWKDNARSCGLGYQSDVKEVQQLGGVAWYIAKYQAKMLQNSNLPKYLRRVRHSNGWAKLPELPKPEGWHFAAVPKNMPLQSEANRYQELGYTVVLADENSSWDWLEMFTGA